jgi:threonine/homoserine/homoserine lactone efflux protein
MAPGRGYVKVDSRARADAGARWRRRVAGRGYTFVVPHTSTLVVFVGAAIALLLTPGPAVLYIVTRSIEEGRLAGLVSVLGICTGTLVHVVAATLGLSALLVSSALAFATVKYLGAAGRRVERASLRRVFTQGVVVNVLNPHTALFFFAFLPQFINPSNGRVPAQMLALGLLFVCLSAATDSGWAIAAGTAGEWIKEHPRFTRGQRYVTGGALIGLGAATAITGNRHQ